MIRKICLHSVSRTMGLLTLGLLLCPIAAVAAAEQCGLKLCPAVGAPGSTVKVGIIADTTLPVKGLQAAVAVPQEASVEEFAPAVPPCKDKVDFLGFEKGEGCVSVGFVVDFSGQDCTFPDGSSVYLGALFLKLPETGDSVCLDFIQSCGNPPKGTVLALKGPEATVRCVPEPEDLKGACITINEGQAPPADLRCTVEGKQVLLSWTAAGTYFQVEVRRDGELIATLDGTSDSFADEEATCGVHTYSIRAFADCLGYEPLECTAEVPPPCPADFKVCACGPAGDPPCEECPPGSEGVKFTWTEPDTVGVCEIWQLSADQSVSKIAEIPIESPGASRSFELQEVAEGEHTYVLVVRCGEVTCRTDPQTVLVIRSIDLRIGDSNCDGRIDIADAICTLGLLFGPPSDSCKTPCCKAQMDSNGDGGVDIADAVKTLAFLFSGGVLNGPGGVSLGGASGSCMAFPRSDVSLPCDNPCNP